MKFLLKYINAINSISKKTGSVVSWLTFLLVLVVCYDVIIRYLFNESSASLQELEWHLFALIFLVAAAYTLNIDNHVRVDVFYTRLSIYKKAWINLAGSLLFLVPFCILAILSSLKFVEASWLVKETSPDAGGLPARFILKTFIPISFFLLLLEGLSLSFKSLFQIMNKHVQEKEEGV